MSWRIKFNVLPAIGAEETVLYFKNWLWAASGKSLPSCRLFRCFGCMQPKQPTQSAKSR